MTTEFGPTAIATPANALTVARILVSPILFWMIVKHGHSWPALALWIVLAVTDGFDGYLARKHGTTRSGAFLDPLADKILVLGALAALVIEGRFWWVPVAIIATRELVISAYRSVMARQGVTVPARIVAKVKTVIQEIAIGFALLPLTAERASWIAIAVLWISIGAGIISAVQYFLDASKVATAQRATG